MNIAENIGDQLVTRRTGKLSLNRQRVRIVLYLGLLLTDCAAIRAGFSVGVSVRGWMWLAPNGVELGWLILPLHILIGLRNGAFSRLALEQRTESVRRATSAFMIATCAIALLIFFQYAGPLVSRLAFGIAIVCSLGFLTAARLLFLILFVVPLRDGLVGELLIVDGVPPPAREGNVFDAQAAGITPDMRNPDVLSRLALLVEPFDRVLVASRPEHQHGWAMLMKAYNVTGEILLDSGSPLGAIGIGRFHETDTVIVARGPMSLGNRMKKRLVDIAFASAALIFLAPLLLVTAIAIKLDSPGPILFSQVRLGRGNKRFKILKFRSMRVEKSDFSGTRSATLDDDRITRVGKIIRKTSIDELPQILNVLKGEMSIVGPRPHALGSLAGDQLFWEVTERYWLRHTLKPGITGLAQVRGFRGATHERADLENRLQADLEYIDGWRLWRDIAIIFNTLRVVVHRRAF